MAAKAETPSKTWGQRYDDLLRLRKQAETTLAALDDVQGMVQLEQEAGQLRTQIEGYKQQEGAAKAAAQTAEAEQRAAEARLANVLSRVEAETKKVQQDLMGLKDEERQHLAEIQAAADKLRGDLVKAHDATVAELDRERKRLEDRVAALQRAEKEHLARVDALR